ncbi:MAG TPA: M20/M25/M40 family metallo-hydrolase [Dehalococcoidia bacterium]|jgi:tripeptide aminopeptidase|nr:M20/M25/M40 family metallo-hydrolase [Dehalococcoidia bacterium]
MVQRERLVETFLELVRIDSPSGQEAAIARWLVEILQGLGAQAGTDDHGNVIANIPGRGEPILLSAHMDTVQPGEGVQPIVEGDTIRTDGTTVLGGDPKAGVAAIVEGLRAVRERGGEHRAVEVAFTRGEEIGLVGARHLDYERVRARQAVVFDGEGSVANITSEAPSHLTIDLQITGRAAHAGVEPEKGLSAIVIAAEFIRGYPQGRLDSETTGNIGLIQGGSARNAVPEEVTIQAELRSRDKAKLQALREQVEASVRELRLRYPEAKLALTIEDEYGGYKLQPGDPLVELVSRTLRGIGLEPKLLASGGGTDGNIFTTKGIAAVVVGLGGEHFHTKAETVSIQHMEEAARFCEALLRA